MKSNRPKKSDVWKYYEIDTDDDSRAICNLCKPSKIISRGSKLKGPQSYGTSALWAHLKLSHKQEYSSLEKCPSYPSRMHTANKHHRLYAKAKKVLLNVNDGHSIFTLNNRMEETCIQVSSEHEEHLNLIGQMIALDNQPISIVEEEGFKRLLKSFLPNCNVINSLYFGNHVLPHIYNTTRNKIQTLLQNVEYLTLSLDIDQSALQTETLLVINATWLDSECKQSNCTLSTNILSTFPSHKIIDALIQETLKEWNINKENVHLFIHPYAKKNMNSVQVVQGVQNETHFQHLIQLLIEDSLLSQSNVTRVLDLCRNLICYSTETRDTIDLLNLLHNVPLLKRPESELVLDSSSNWRSTYKMLHNIRANMEDINNISTLNQALSISNEDWSIISQVLDIFEPIHEITKSTTPLTNFISNIIPYMATIQRYLNTNPSTIDSEIVQDVKNVIYRKVYDDYHIEERECLVLATVLDPRYKSSFISDRCKQNSKSWLLEQHSNSQPEFNPQSVKQEFSEKKGIWSCFKEIAEENVETTSSENKLQREINEYLNTRLLEREQNPLDWWRANKSFFPNLFTIAKRFLSPPMDLSLLQKKNNNLLMRLRRSVDEDAQTNSLLDINQRLFLHFNLSSQLEN